MCASVLRRSQRQTVAGAGTAGNSRATMAIAMAGMAIEGAESTAVVSVASVVMAMATVVATIWS